MEFCIISGILRTVFAVLFIGLVAWGYQAIQSPPPKLCSSPIGPPLTWPRVKIRDGVPKDVAHHKIIFVHGFDACRHHAYVAKTLSPVIICFFFCFHYILCYLWGCIIWICGGIFQDVAEDLGVYIVSFDRPGYGESDLHPSQTVKSLALDIEELADKLGLGSKFYIIGFSIGVRLFGGALSTFLTGMMYSGLRYFCCLKQNIWLFFHFLACKCLCPFGWTCISVVTNTRFLFLCTYSAKFCWSR